MSKKDDWKKDPDEKTSEEKPKSKALDPNEEANTIKNEPFHEKTTGDIINDILKEADDKDKDEEASEEQHTAQTEAEAEAETGAKAEAPAAGGKDVKKAAAEAKVKALEAKVAKITKQLEDQKKKLKAAQKASGEATSEGSGISVVQFIVDDASKAERLSDQLLQKKLIADVEIVTGGYQRFFMRNKEEIIDDNLVKMKFVTTDFLVPKVMEFVTKNNPNSDTTQVPLVATQLTGSSPDYLQWVKKQFFKQDKKSSDAPDDDTNLQSDATVKVHRHHDGWDKINIDDLKDKDPSQFEKKFDLVQTKDSAVDQDDEDNFEIFDTSGL